jgi:hypothetical protein
MDDPTERLAKSFAAKWRRDDATGCWIWTASVAGGGYGQIRLPSQRRNEYGHRVSWILHVGPIPADQQVLHRCDNRLCVNPEHLFLGTQAENMADMVFKGRQLFGQRNNGAKLSDGDVRNILASRASPRWLAWRYGVQINQIYRIIRGDRWGHIRGRSHAGMPESGERGIWENLTDADVETICSTIDALVQRYGFDVTEIYRSRSQCGRQVKSGPLGGP